MRTPEPSQPSAVSRWVKNATSLLVFVVLASCGGGSSQSDTPTPTKLAAVLNISPSPDIAVIDVKKLSETRVSRTVFDYVFSVTLKNNGVAAQSNVAATLTTVGAGASIIDGAVQVGSMAAGASVTPPDTITIRQDRALPFSPTSLVWQITTSAPAPGVGILLPGNPADLASAHRQDYEATLTASDLSTGQLLISDATYYRTQLLSSIPENATVGQVNAALNAVNGRIVVMWANNAVVTIQVPDPGSSDALDSIAAALDATGAFYATGKLYLPHPDGLPPSITQADAVDVKGPIRHQLASHLAPAWSANNIDTSQSKVQVIIIDYFGRGEMDPALINGSATGASTGNLCTFKDATGKDVLGPCQHGYHVLGILDGSFGGNKDPGGKITGSLPKDLKINLIDLSAVPVGTNWLTFMEKAMSAIVKASPESRFVLSMSLGSCTTPTSCLSGQAAAYGGYKWRLLMRGLAPNFDYDTQVLQVTSAGNGGPTTHAPLNSGWNAAALMEQLGTQKPFTNGLVVENRTVAISIDGTPKPGARSTPNACERYGSTLDGNIGAIGTDVSSFIDPQGNVGPMCGTSMATPQVAGLAAYMLAIADTMSPKPSIADIVTKIKNGTFNPDVPSAPPIDAYASILSLDADYSHAPVRLSTLKLEGSNLGGPFTFQQAQKFLQAFFPSAYPSPPTPAVLPDFSSFNLNGSGFTGDASKTARYKLDPSSKTFDVLQKYPNGLAITIDENHVSDFEILCYYINSALFDSSPAQMQLFNAELQMISTKLGKTVSCANPVVTLNVLTTNPGWTGLPAHIVMSNFAFTSINNFQIFGDPLNTCGSGERGSPLFSSSVPTTAVFQSANILTGVPENISGPGVNRRPCSSFFAFVPSGQVWINATGRGQRFGGPVVLDWEIQVRYSNGDLNGVGKRCEVGVVANSGFFGKNFDATCDHASGYKVAQ